MSIRSKVPGVASGARWTVLVGLGLALAACDIDTAPPNPSSAIQDGGRANGSTHDGGVTIADPAPIVGISSSVFRAAPIITPPSRDDDDDDDDDMDPDVDEVDPDPEPMVMPDRCGDGTVDPEEACDWGKDPCCAEDCKAPKPSGTVCLAAAGDCDVAEVCDGETFACPDDALRGGETVCRGAATDCDAEEVCDGVSRQCPEDLFQPATTACRTAADVCDAVEYCTGTSLDCPADGYLPATEVCRTQATGHLCDAVELCTGSGIACPADRVSAVNTVCNISQGSCDAFAVCNGESRDCPPLMQDIAPAGTVCRQAAPGSCDAPEVCNGQSPACPSDRVRPPGYECRPRVAGNCDIAAEVCNGETAQCPADQLRAAGFACRPSAGDCDVAERCDGSTPICPPIDAFARGGECRGSDGGCDLPETCNGSGPNCPTDRFNVGRVCRMRQPGPCDVTELCIAAADCPADGFDEGSVCREATSDACDVEEKCGRAPACPADVGVGDGRMCRPGDTTEDCIGVARCNGSSACPASPAAARGTSCRPVANGRLCDVAETCDGTLRTCPLDGFAGSTQMCRGLNGDSCDLVEFCNGGPDCPPDVGMIDNGSTRAGCRAASTICEGIARCDGTPRCPDNKPVPKEDMKECRVGTGECDPAELCDGTLTCPADKYLEDGKLCGDPKLQGMCEMGECCSMGVCCPGETKETGAGCGIEGATLVFVTSRRVPGIFGGIFDADKICNEAADAANLAGTYTAWVSGLDQAGAQVNALSRVNPKGPYMRIDGKQVAGSRSFIEEFAKLEAPINVDELGTPEVKVRVWTGTKNDGYGTGVDCGNWVARDKTGIAGDSSSTDAWSSASDSGINCVEFSAALYCFQDGSRVITDPRGQ